LQFAYFYQEEEE